MICALALGFGIRLWGIVVLKQGLSHDESVSYLCAAAQGSAFEVGMPLLVDIDLVAADIQRFYAKPDRLQFGIVSRDLVQDDIHPPLYFWILHIVYWSVGFDIRIGPLINLTLTLVLLILIFRLSKQVLGGILPALACCTIWFLSPAVVPIDLEARHYQLFGVLALTMFMVARRPWHGESNWRDLLVLSMVNALGLLSHYYYGFLLIPGALIMFNRFGISRPTYLYMGSLFLSLIIFLACFPEFVGFIPRYLAERAEIAGGPTDHLERIKALVLVPLFFLSYWKWMQFAVLASITVLLLRHWNATGRGAQIWQDFPPAIRDIVVHVIWYAVFSAGLYATGVSPTQAVGNEYFSYLWPLLSLLVIWCARTMLSVPVRSLLFAIYTAQLAISCGLTVQGSDYVSDLVPPGWTERMAKSDLLITNEARRGYLPRMVMTLPADLPLRVSSNSGLQQAAAPALDVVCTWMVVPKQGSAFPGFAQRMRAAGFRKEEQRLNGHLLSEFHRQR